jgi:tRNA A-37 threonylcarbamoyl transferase component Bud32
MQPVTGSGRVVAGRYELLDLVGHGAMGTVWRAKDLRLDREVAVKEVRLPGPMTQQDRSVLRERSLREARVAARLMHPGVVTVHDVIEAEGSPWIIMELVPSRSLAQVLAEDGPLPPARAAAMGMTLLEALGSAHAAGVVHRDVKPGNILITPEGRAVLTDFGIATLHGDPRLTQAGMVMGTPGFCAPERIRGEPASPASDLWSLGATLYAAVEGRGPFEGQGSAMAVLANIVHGDPPPPTRAGALKPVILALMKRDPAARPNATRARWLLTAACSGCGSGTSASAPAGPGASHGAGTGASPLDGSSPSNGALDRAPADDVGNGATGGGTRDEPGIRGGTPAAGGTLPLPQSLPQDDAAFAGQQPAAALTLAAALPPPVPDSPVTAPAVSAHPAPAALVTARTSAASGAAPAPANPQGPGSHLQRRGRHRRALLFGGGPRSARR